MNQRVDNQAGKDVFSAVADGYVRFRPRYPEALFDCLAGIAPARQLAWDVGCGSGQATQDLADRFTQVVGTDISAAQIGAAPAYPNIEYRVAPAHVSGLPDHSVDLITVAQALHWFDLDAFYAEVRRVAKPDGVIAVWSYGTINVGEDAIYDAVMRFLKEKLGPYWPAARRHVDSGYRELPFPFEEITAPPFGLTVDWTLPQLLGYARSWSAVAHYVEAHGADPVVALGEEIGPLWGDPYVTHKIRWPLTIRIGRVNT